jgi:sodium/hydrogen antiporter
MAWDHLNINRPHLAYIILGGFTSLFMLVSLFVKEKLYIGEATVATICGIIFGPHAADLFSPNSWGNVDQITLEVSRIVLVVQCFAVGVELPKYYMEKHWRSVIFLLVPVMTFGYLITSLFIWWMVPTLSWLESLCVAACVTATDPVLASSVVGKGKFAKRVPKHLRDLLSAESGCNDGMAFPFIYLALYLIHYHLGAREVTFNWLVITVLYECVFGAFYGVAVGYIGRHMIKAAERHGLIDRESFLVFYFVLALFCAGSGSILGVDDLLVGFAAGVGFSNDGWFTEKTEEAHVSNVIDLLLNLAYFVYFGAIIPWEQYNRPEWGLTPWRLVVIAIFVILFRRIPIMLALKPVIPDVKTWREALFAGHFGPIGVGAVFVAILARAELETGETTPLAELPPFGSESLVLIEVIWPITTFLVVCSIVVHGSSIAVFTLGKHINTLTITMSYTQATEDPSWMSRLPRIASQSKGSMSMQKAGSMDSSSEGLPFPPGTLPPVGVAGNFLRRQKEDEESKPVGHVSSRQKIGGRQRKKNEFGRGGPGGPISQSAIFPASRSEAQSAEGDRSGSETLMERGSQSVTPEEGELNEKIEQNLKDQGHEHRLSQPEVEEYREGDNVIVEDKDGNIIDEKLAPHNQPGVHESVGERVEGAEKALEHEGEKLKQGGEQIAGKVQGKDAQPQGSYAKLKGRIGQNKYFKRTAEEDRPKEPKKRGPALAYQFGNTIIVEDEDGEVVKKYDIPRAEQADRGERRGSVIPGEIMTRKGLQRMGTWTGFGPKDGGKPAEEGGEPSEPKKRGNRSEEQEDPGLRFRMPASGGHGGRRLSVQDFIKEIQQLDPKARAEIVAEQPVQHKKEIAKSSSGSGILEEAGVSSNSPSTHARGRLLRGYTDNSIREEKPPATVSEEKDEDGNQTLSLVTSNEEEVPYYSDLQQDLRSRKAHVGETAAERRRRQYIEATHEESEDSEDDGTERITPAMRHQAHPSHGGRMPSVAERGGGEEETEPERRRREAALGLGREQDSDSESDSDRSPMRQSRTSDWKGKGKSPLTSEPVSREESPRGTEAGSAVASPTSPRASGIRFADQPTVGGGRLQWGSNVGREKSGDK